MKRVIRYTADIRSIAFLVLASSAHAYFLLKDSSFSFWNVVFLIVGFLFTLSTVGFNHNHKHLATSDYKWINRVLDIWSTLILGRAASWVTVTHNLNHHKHHGFDKDWMSVKKYPHGKSFAFIRYLLDCFATVKANKPNVDKKIFVRYQEMLKWEWLSLWAYIGLWLLINPFNFVAYIFPTLFACYFLLIWMNLIQHHDAIESEDVYKTSMNITGRAFNFILLDSGYHTTHHVYPNLHWSQLKGRFEKEKHLIPDSLNAKGFFELSFRFIKGSRQQSHSKIPTIARPTC